MASAEGRRAVVEGVVADHLADPGRAGTPRRGRGHPSPLSGQLASAGRPLGRTALLAATVGLLAALDVDSGPEIVFVPMLLFGLGVGALACSSGASRVAVSDEEARRWRPSEHHDQSRRPRHGARRCDPDRLPVERVPDEHRPELGDSRPGQVRREGPARRRSPVHLRQRPRDRPGLGADGQPRG